MGKKRKSKRKSTSKGRKSRRSTVSAPINYFYNGTGSFTLPNGDIYEGEYCAHRNGMIWREGNGIYYTQDGHVYQGQWRDDKLIDYSPLRISYPNGDIFEGTLAKNKYERAGEVVFQGGITLSALFQANRPIGTVHLIDPMGQLWKSIPETEHERKDNTNKIFCRQEQVFFNNIHPMRGIKKDILKNIQPEEVLSRVSIPGEGYEISYFLTDHDLEQMIFSKKPKIDTTMDWEDTPWYRNFANFKKKRENVLNKLEKHERLTEDEKKWYCQYAMARRHRHLTEKEKLGRHKDNKVDTNLLETFYSEAHKHSAKPYATFYPSYYWHTQREEEASEESLKVEEEIAEEVTEEMIEEESEESVYCIESEEMLTPKPSVACGTSSLFKFVKVATGTTFQNPCKSIDQSI